MIVRLSNAAVVTEVNCKLPKSKSLSNRLILIHQLVGNLSLVHVSDCDDSELLYRALLDESESLNFNNAGTPYRFALAYFALTGQKKILDGSSRMRERPIDELVMALRSLGANIEYLKTDGFPPVRIIEGVKHGGKIAVDISKSSQFASALMLIAPYLHGGLKIQLTGKESSLSYLKMTYELIREFGVNAEWSDGDTITISEGKYQNLDFPLESDWSAASYFYSILSLSSDGTIVLNGLMKKSLQGDAVLPKLFLNLGVKTDFVNETLVLKKAERKTDSFHFDLGATPDIVPAVTVALCAIPGLHKIEGISKLKYKESDRIQVLKSHLSQLGVEFQIQSDSVTIDTRHFEPIENFVVETFDDHRMAMSMACLVKILDKVVVNDAEVVSKSFPNFWEEMAKLIQVNVQERN